jgi:hypothetical protein
VWRWLSSAIVLIMEAVCISLTLVNIYQTTSSSMPEDIVSIQYHWTNTGTLSNDVQPDVYRRIVAYVGDVPIICWEKWAWLHGWYAADLNTFVHFWKQIHCLQQHVFTAFKESGTRHSGKTLYNRGDKRIIRKCRAASTQARVKNACHGQDVMMELSSVHSNRRTLLCLQQIAASSITQHKLRT